MFYFQKLEDGSLTVNEFLSHFGIKFVIHRSRPSALPVSVSGLDYPCSLCKHNK